MVLFRLKVNRVGSVKTTSKFLFIFSLTQCLFIAVFMSGNVRLYFVTIEILLDVADFSNSSSCVPAIVNKCL